MLLASVGHIACSWLGRRRPAVLLHCAASGMGDICYTAAGGSSQMWLAAGPWPSLAYFRAYSALTAGSNPCTCMIDGQAWTAPHAGAALGYIRL